MDDISYGTKILKLNDYISKSFIWVTKDINPTASKKKCRNPSILKTKENYNDKKAPKWSKKTLKTQFFLKFCIDQFDPISLF